MNKSKNKLKDGNRKTMKLIRRIASVLITVIIFTFQNQGIFAQAQNDQSANGFRISPVRNELTIEKGTSQTVSIMVENPSSLPIKAAALINDFQASDSEDGQPRILLDNTFAPNHSLKRLVSNIPDTDIAPGGRKEVKVTITIPTNAVAGGYYGAVRFVPAENKKSANIALTASVGSIFLVNVPGNIKEHLELVQFTAAVNGSGKKIITSGKVSIITRLKNDGDTHEKPFGKIQVKNSKGVVVELAEINNTDPQANILPDSTRKFETTLTNKKWFGRYTVTASLGYNPSDGDLINAKTTFWYIPAWMVAVFSVLVLVLVFAAYMLYRKIRVRAKRKHR